MWNAPAAIIPLSLPSAGSAKHTTVFVFCPTNILAPDIVLVRFTATTVDVLLAAGASEEELTIPEGVERGATKDC